MYKSCSLLTWRKHRDHSNVIYLFFTSMTLQSISIHGTSQVGVVKRRLWDTVVVAAVVGDCFASRYRNIHFLIKFYRYSNVYDDQHDRPRSSRCFLSRWTVWSLWQQPRQVSNDQGWTQTQHVHCPVLCSAGEVLLCSGKSTILRLAWALATWTKGINVRTVKERKLRRVLFYFYQFCFYL